MDEKQPIVFGKTFICKRCGHIAQHKSRFRVAAATGQNDAYVAEFCEYCVPGSMLGVLIDMAFDLAPQEAHL
jgi:ribosomal protein S27AE